MAMQCAARPDSSAGKKRRPQNDKGCDVDAIRMAGLLEAKIESKSKTKVNDKIKNGGQACPSHILSSLPARLQDY